MHGKTLLTGTFILIAASVLAADNGSVLLHPDQYKAVTEIKGTIQDVDDSTRRITLEDSAHQRVTVIVTSDTAVTDQGNHDFNWMSLRVGDPVDAYYEPKAHIALKIDRQPTAAESILGIDHPVGDRL